MHSSRMRTVRYSSHLRGGRGMPARGYLPARIVSSRGGVCLSWGCLPARGSVSLKNVCQGVSACQGVFACQGVSTCQEIVRLPGGVCLPGGVHLP